MKRLEIKKRVAGKRARKNHADKLEVGGTLFDAPWMAGVHYGEEVEILDVQPKFHPATSAYIMSGTWLDHHFSLVTDRVKAEGEDDLCLPPPPQPLDAQTGGMTLPEGQIVFTADEPQHLTSAHEDAEQPSVDGDVYGPLPPPHPVVPEAVEAEIRLAGRNAQARRRLVAIPEDDVIRASLEAAGAQSHRRSPDEAARPRAVVRAERDHSRSARSRRRDPFRRTRAVPGRRTAGDRDANAVGRSGWTRYRR